MKGYIALLLLLVIASASCKKPNTASKIPQISFVGLEPNTIAIQTEDTLFIGIRIIDGDADLGISAITQGEIADIYLLDSRSSTGLLLPGEDTIELFFPTIPPKAQNPDKGVDAESIIFLDAYRLRFADTTKAIDTVSYQIYIKDKAGNTSNIIKTPEIYLTK